MTATAPTPPRIERQVLDDLELQSAVMVRNFELLRRRGEMYGDINRAEYLLLRILDSDGPSDIGSLAKRIGLDPSTAGRQVNAMEEDGLVRRDPAPTDRRRSIIAPTDKGRRLMRTVRRQRRQNTEDLLAQWSPRELRTLARMFRRWNETVSAAYLA